MQEKPPGGLSSASRARDVRLALEEQQTAYVGWPPLRWPESKGGSLQLFKAKTKRLFVLAQKFPRVIQELETIFAEPTVIYVDYGNVRNWSERMEWHVDLKRLKQLIDSFQGSQIDAKFYYGTRAGVPESEQLIKDAGLWGYDVHTKPVKPIKLSIDVTSISGSSPDIINHFVFGPLVKTFTIELIETLNTHLRDLNRKGVVSFDDLKCNFDVEISTHMVLDLAKGVHNNFMLWSCDSDFAGHMRAIMASGKNAIVCGTAGMVARELNMLRGEGLQVFDVKKLKEFICWPRELPEDIKICF